MKKNIEIRFFFDKNKVEKMLKQWRKEKRKFELYSFVDYYFRKGKNIIKIRKWNSPHKPRLELIAAKRNKGIKEETSRAIEDVKEAIQKLEKKGYKKVAVIEKKKAWLITGKPAYAIEYIPGLGWSGEIEVPEKDKKLIPEHIKYLKSCGARDFSKKSLLELFIKKRME